MTHSFQKFWLKVTAIGIGCFGPVFFLGSMPATSEPIRFTMDILSWPLDGRTTWTHPDTLFLSALAGGFLLGWGVLVWCLQATVFDHAPDAVRKAVLTSTISWLILDSLGSAASGNPSNVFFNTLLFVFLTAPLWQSTLSQTPQEA